MNEWYKNLTCELIFWKKKVQSWNGNKLLIMKFTYINKKENKNC